MRHEDIALSASSARGYTRHWRAHKLSWNTIGKIRYLMDGAIEYMDEVTLCYPQMKFNKLRMVLGFKQESELTELIEQAETFYIVRQKDTGEMVAFMTPLVPHRFVPTFNQTIEEPIIKSEVFDAKADLLFNPKNSDKIADNLRVHKKSINMKMLLKVNTPTFHATPNEEAYQRISDGLKKLFSSQELSHFYFGEFIYHYQRKYHVGDWQAQEVLACYLVHHLTRHMACRVGIENWPAEAITKWVRNFFGAKRLPFVITEAHELWQKRKKERTE